jgi:multiple sugar transport system substrate-binding protein
MPILVFYHKGMLDEAGLEAPPTDAADTSWTTDKMLELATAMAHDVSDPTQAAWGMVFGPGQLGTYSWRWGMDPFNNEGGPELTEAYQTGKITEAFYNTPEMAEYFQWLVDNTYARQVAPRPSDTDAITQTVGWPMMSGRIGMFVDGAWQLTVFADVKPEWAWGVAPLPYGPTGINTPPLFNDSWMLSEGAAHPEEGFTFLKYLTLENGAKLYAEIAGFFPANKNNYDIFFNSMLGIPNIALDRAQLEQAILSSFEFGYPTPGKTVESYPEWNTAFNQTTAPMFNNEADVPSGLQALQEKFESIIATKA